MNRIDHKPAIAAFVSAALLAGCATTNPPPKETIPVVTVAPNASGIKIDSSENHPPRNLLGAAGADTPSGVTLSVEQIPPPTDAKHVFFIPASGQLQVVSLERIADYGAGPRSIAGTLPVWISLIEDPARTDKEIRSILYNGQLDEIPWINDGRCFHAKLRRLTFPWGRAILFLTCYVQGPGNGLANDDLILTIQGFTNDGRYAVNGRFGIHHPKLTTGPWPQRPSKKGLIEFDLDKQDDNAEAWLDAQPDDSFQPTLTQYETFLQSLQITPPAKK